MKEIKNTQEMYNEYYASILIPYTTKKISVYALEFDEDAYKALFRLGIHTLYDLLLYIEKPNHSFLRKIVSMVIDRDLIRHTVEQALTYQQQIKDEFATVLAPEVMEKYDMVQRILSKIPINQYTNPKLDIMGIGSFGDLHMMLLQGNDECTIEVVEDLGLRECYQQNCKFILDHVGDMDFDEEEISNRITTNINQQQKRNILQ